MDDMISKILEIEDRAQAIVSDVKKDKEKLEKNLDEKTENLKVDIDQRSKNKITYLTDYEQNEAQNKLKEIASKLEVQKKKLEEKYNQEKDKWVQQIFNNIVR